MTKVDYTSYSNCGSRDVNEDNHGIAVYQDSFCFVVADGLGGHGGGEVASNCAVEAVCSLFSRTGFTDCFFEEAFDAAQTAIIEAQLKVNAVSQMKTTLVILVLHDNRAYWAHIGDSRLYHFKGSKMKERTIDHSVPQMLALSGEILEKDIRHHPDRNRLLRVLGIKGEKPRFESGKPIKNNGTHTFLLCTDGYWELIDEHKMTDMLCSSATIEEWLIKMNTHIRQTGENADMDNYTAIAVRAQSKGLLWR